MEGTQEPEVTKECLDVWLELLKKKELGEEVLRGFLEVGLII